MTRGDVRPWRRGARKWPPRPFIYTPVMRTGKKRKVRSVPQRKLMGWAYACATDPDRECPPGVRDVADSFTRKRKRKGLESLRRMASTKHAGLSPTRVSESRLLKFDEYLMNEDLGGEAMEAFNELEFLYSLEDYEINEYLHDFITTDNTLDKMEYCGLIVARLGELRRLGRDIQPEKASLAADRLQMTIDEHIARKNKYRK